MQPIISYNDNFSKVNFSILVPSYNRPNFLYKTIKSILEINYSSFELIISDDNSPSFNEILEVIKSFNILIPFKLYHQSQNIGPTENKNFLVQESKGEYIILLGDDDLINPKLLTYLEFEIKKNETVEIFGFGYDIIDEFGNIINTLKSFKNLFFRNNNNFENLIFFEGNIIPFYFFHPFTVCFKKTINIKYKKEAHIGYDYLFLYESILNNFCIKVLPIVGFSWRKAQTHGEYQNLSNNKQSDLISRIGIYKYFFLNKKFISKMNFKLKEDHICKFIGDTLLINKNNIIINLEFLKNEIDNIGYKQLLYYTSNYFTKYKIVFNKFYYCIRMQETYCLHYFILRLNNIRRKKYYSSLAKYNGI